MKAAALLFVLIVAVSAQQPTEPQNLTASAAANSIVATVGADNPLSIPHLGWSAYWQLPDSANIWIPEYSVDQGSNWIRCSNQGSLPPWNYTETGTNWIYPRAIQLSEWMVRITNVGVIPPLPPPNTNPQPPSAFAQLPPRSVRCPTCLP